jgi:hypothetical protein
MFSSKPLQDSPQIAFAFQQGNGCIISAHEGVLYRGTKDIEEVAKTLDEIARTLDHLASGSKKPIVRTVTEEKYRAEEEGFIAEAEKALRKPID